ncbi:ATP-binding cassette subfamily F protein 3 [Desulfosalsimonas propionicica]|uniref:ATP-binding cassette subfamily F protein 3 n=1 Tax=Desulfosalsimonas propionicica TaxID=332175 RepID=A0A7W0C783_9BACT|nr:ABC-F family ATP-binding cassette domain-containing protein [Desulfosalsimonas propionicica]MBA2880418.1 ATP-binding cassette subfamily F protein 3 [Desulfosalsimonas propionicica]
MINIEGLNKSYGGHVLFDDVSLRVHAGERLGLVGRNGHGKTTLFRLIIGDETPDAGSISRPRNYRIGHVAQQLIFSAPTVLEEGMRGLPADRSEAHWEVEKILAGLGFCQADMGRAPAEFSGGYQIRLNLAKVLVSRPDMLLLDEPTNYLDITSIRWIRQFLVNWPGEVFLITHDRSFMDGVATHIAGIHRRKIKKIAGNTEKYYTQIAQEEEVYEKTRQNDERKRKDIERFISRFRAKARLANLVQSRVKTLSKLTRKEKLEQAKNLDFSFNSPGFTGKYMLQAENLAFSYNSGQASEPAACLIDDFSMTIAPDERICIMGRNGAGKTTLLRLLAGELAAHAGRIENHPNAVKGLFEQTNIHTLSDERTVEEEIMAANPDMGRQASRSICGAMLFEGDQALKKIRVLSGGEKCRVMLGRLLAAPANFLLLDEPTNHFDMESCDALLAAIDAFDGAVVMVTHNEMFLHALARRLVVFQGGGIEVFDGTYQRFLENVGWEEDEPAAGRRQDPAQKADCAGQISKKDYRRLRSKIVAEKSRALKPVEDQIEAVENDIVQWEQQLGDLNARMQEASINGGGREIAELSRALHECRQNIDAGFERLESLSAKADAKRAEFDAQMEQLDNQRPF